MQNAHSDFDLFSEWGLEPMRRVYDTLGTKVLLNIVFGGVWKFYRQ